MYEKQSQEIKQLIKIDHENRTEIEQLQNSLNALNNSNQDKAYYESIIKSKEKEIDYLKRVNQELRGNINNPNNAYIETVLQAKDKEIEYLKRQTSNKQNEDQGLQLFEKDKEIEELSQIIHRLENEKNNLLYIIVNFIEKNNKYINSAENLDEISLSEIEAFFKNMELFINHIIDDNKNLVNKLRQEEENIEKLKVELRKNENSFIR